MRVTLKENRPRKMNTTEVTLSFDPGLFHQPLFSQHPGWLGDPLIQDVVQHCDIGHRPQWSCNVSEVLASDPPPCPTY